MKLLNDEIVQEVSKMLANLTDDVTLMVFTPEGGCEYCPQIVQLAEEVAATSDKVTVEKYDLATDKAKAQELNITVAPAIAIVGKKDYGIRYYGIPSGHEFSTLLFGIQKAGGQPSELDEEATAYLNSLQEPVLWQVFVTPTCPYCPRSAILAYEMAAASDMVKAEVYEAMEFQALSQKFNVMGVPLNVINGKERVEGAAPPQMMIDAFKKALA